MLTAGESTPRERAPRPWAASLQRPAAKILVAGGLTLAGWLLGAALSGSTASAAETPACPEAPAVSTVDHAADHAAKPLSHARHRKSHHGTSALTCTAAPKTGSADPAPVDETQQVDETSAAPETTKDSSPTEEPAKAAKTTSPDSSAAEAPKATSTGGNLLGGLVGNVLGAVSGAAGTTKDTSAGESPATTKVTSAGGNLLGGLVGNVLEVVGGTLSTVTGTVDAVTGTVGAVTDTLSHTVLAPLTQPPADNPGAPALLPLDDLLGPLLSGGSNSGGVTATVPAATVPTVTIVVTQGQVAGTVPAAVSEAVAAPQQTPRVALGHLIVRQMQPLPVVEDQPRDSGTHLRNGGGSDPAPGLPGGTTAPSAPAPTAAPGHDGSAGARHAFAVHTDDVTTTQLKLIGTSRDHEVDGAGREAALPTTSPD